MIQFVDESQRMQSFKLYHKAWPSDYMQEPVWSTIEVRFVCIVDGFADVPKGAKPPNIFEVLTYEALMSGEFYRDYTIDQLPETAQSCGYPLDSELRQQSSQEGAPLFLNLIQDITKSWLVLTGPAGGSYLYSPELVFTRYSLEMVTKVTNFDIIAWSIEDQMANESSETLNLP